MESISIEGTPKTPTVNFDAATGIVEIKGRSIPENSIEFYRPLVEWLEDYSKGPQKLTTVNIQLEYFNTSSSRLILDVLDILKKFQDEGHKVKVNWHFDPDDPDVKDEVEDFEIESGMDIELIEMT